MKTAILAVPALFLLAAPIGNADTQSGSGLGLLCIQGATVDVTGNWDFTLSTPNDDGDWDITFSDGTSFINYGDESGIVPLAATTADVCLYGDYPSPLDGPTGVTMPLWASLGSTYEYTETAPPAEICDDGIDNDRDGLTDLADSVDCPPPEILI